MILLYAFKQNFSILRHLVGDILHFEFDAYCVILPGASDLKLPVRYVVYAVALRAFVADFIDMPVRYSRVD